MVLHLKNISAGRQGLKVGQKTSTEFYKKTKNLTNLHTCPKRRKFLLEELLTAAISGLLLTESLFFAFRALSNKNFCLRA